ncbi:hypothetical protein T492DRAFT_1139776 [Pavlovales sp. CCMP2436]|nr:hypothetical protein T492DRAFT_1139776 [Pavlovales sp. CCMP2436]
MSRLGLLRRVAARAQPALPCILGHLPVRCAACAALAAHASGYGRDGGRRLSTHRLSGRRAVERSVARKAEPHRRGGAVWGDELLVSRTAVRCELQVRRRVRQREGGTVGDARTQRCTQRPLGHSEPDGLERRVDAGARLALILRIPRRRIVGIARDGRVAQEAQRELRHVSGRLRQVPEAEMRKKIEIDVTATVADAVKHLAAQRITFACVVDHSRKVVGAFTERDYLRADASSFFMGRYANVEPVASAMSSAGRMLSVRTDTTVFASLAMVQSKIWRHVPVLSETDRLKQVIDIRDLLLVLDGGRTDQPAGGEVGPGTALRGVWHGKL